MDAARYQRIRRIFHAVVDGSPEERASLLDLHCGGDTVLREEVERLLFDVSANDCESDWDASSDWIGITLCGRYLIKELLASSDFTRVYLAHDKQLHDRQVIVKRVNVERSQDRWLEDKFRDESEALARIDHPGLVGVLDAAQAPDDTPFLVLPYVTGPTLREAIRENPIAFKRAEHILQQVCLALMAAHDRGVLHRDLKPENIILHPTGPDEVQAVIIDFGLATFTHTQTLSQVTRVVGTLSYMAPEQFKGQVSVRSDLYSLGVIAREILRSRVTADVKKVLAKATAYDDADRYPTIRAFKDDLTRALSGRRPKLSGSYAAWFSASIAPLVVLLAVIGAIVFLAKAPDNRPALLRLGGRAELASVQDTYVSEIKSRDDVPHKGENPLLSGTIGWRSSPMVQFDVATLRGRKLVGPATLKWRVEGVWGHQSQTQTVSVHTMITPWTASAVTWRSFGVKIAPAFSQDYSEPHDWRTITVREGDTAAFFLPPDIVETWIKHPVVNHGLILISSTTNGERDILFTAGAARLILYYQQ